MIPTKPAAGVAEFHTAFDFMSSAHLIIDNVYAKKGDAPRSLVNLTFLALEVSMKSLLASYQGKVKKVHEIRVLHDTLAKGADGQRVLAKVEAEYERIMRGLGKRIPEYNAEFGTLASVVDFLNKDAFLQWRYIFEAIEKELLTGESEAVRFPYFNLFLLAWVFLGEAEKAVGAQGMPRSLHYQRMPFWFSVKLDPTSRSGIRWEAYVNAFMIGAH